LPYYVYVLLCEDDSYYTGYAKDIDSRVKQHTKGSGARYTKMHRPKKLVYTEEFDTRREAVKREREIKKLSHHEKNKLVSHARDNLY
jgi:putative endonuclease